MINTSIKKKGFLRQTIFDKNTNTQKHQQQIISWK